MRTENMDIQVTRMFSVISKIERPTKLRAEYAYQITLSNITPGDIPGFTGLLLAERVEQYENSTWYEVDITRGDHLLQMPDSPLYFFDFEIRRKDRSLTSTLYQKPIKLYVGDVLCDLDVDEVVPINKQVNNISEMQDRQSDFTAQFKIRKTRAMRALFELSGEVGATTTFPYENQPCKVIQDGVELVRSGNLILDDVDDQYYYVAIYSGNISFFKIIESLKITDLLLPGTDHTWSSAVQAASNTNTALDYCYPMMEPSNDGGIIPLTDDGDRAEVYGAWIWCFVKIKAIWDEIFATAGYTCEGALLTDDVFNKLFIPISDRSVKNLDIKPYLYSMKVRNRKVMDGALNGLNCLFGDPDVVVGDDAFKYFGVYYTKWAATYSVRVIIQNPLGVPTHVYLYSGATQVAELENDGSYAGAFIRSYSGEYTAAVFEGLRFYCSYNNGCTYYSLQIVDIKDTKIAFNTAITPHLHLPDMTQAEFVKMICNMLGLVPEANPVAKKVFFWNYSLLYDNIPKARDWSSYLSEDDDKVKFKFGEYAQNNYMRYRDSQDVIDEAGTGILKVNDQTLPLNKDVIEVDLSTCDEVVVLTDVRVSRINFNNYDEKTAEYVMNDSIDPRIVFIDFVNENLGSPFYQKTFGFRSLLSGGVSTDVVTPRRAISTEVAFSTLSNNYSALSKMLFKTNLRRAKFNLPEHEVGGFKHYLPIYLSQYKAYFYVNKINNYMAGRLCTIDLIKL